MDHPARCQAAQSVCLVDVEAPVGGHDSDPGGAVLRCPFSPHLAL